uniref:Putative secreted protein n=1 Tax=Anopheles darlingi TaxID=43151 RepID=A0A2M4DEG7_ANODA
MRCRGSGSLHVHVMRCFALSLCPGFAYCTVRGWRDGMCVLLLQIKSLLTLVSLSDLPGMRPWTQLNSSS